MILKPHAKSCVTELKKTASAQCRQIMRPSVTAT